VLDTNVFVAAGFNPGSDSARLVEAVRGGQLRMIWDDATHAEIEHVLRRIPRLLWTRNADLFAPRTGSSVRSILKSLGLCPIQPTASSPHSPTPSRRRWSLRMLVC
jgi:predicted nucleic acid-binding protein